MIERIKWWWYERKNDCLHPDRVRLALYKVPKEVWDKRPYFIRRYQMAWDYGIGKCSLQSIADFHNVTRERVRQCIYKVWRDHR